MATRPRTLANEIGASGTVLSNGIITSEEYNRSLQGKNALRMYDIMLRSDADIHGMLEVVKQPIIAANWSVKAARRPNGTIDPKDQEIADQISYEIFHNNIDFDDTLYQSLDMLDFGFCLFEQVLERHSYQGADVIGLAKLGFRKQTTIQAWQMEDGSPGVTQRTNNSVFYIPLNKLALFTNKKRGDNYEGISLLRYVFKDWDMKDKLTLVNAMALEQLAKGVPIIGQELNADVGPEELEKAEQAMQEFRANEKGYIRKSKGMTIEMLDMKGSTVKDVLPTIAMHKRSIYASVLATFMDLGGSSGSGAHSLSKDLTSLFLKSEEYIAKTIRSTWNKQIIKPLCDLNFSDLPNGYPELVNGNIGDDDITALATAMSSFASQSLITPDAEMEDVIRGKLGMNPMPEDLKKTYDERHAAPQVTPDTTTPNDSAAKKIKDAPKDTKKTAAISATREAQRRMIEVIFADED